MYEFISNEAIFKNNKGLKNRGQFSVELEAERSEMPKVIGIEGCDPATHFKVTIVPIGAQNKINIGLSSATAKKPQTPSQRLRFILQRYWENQLSGNIDFESFYNQEIEKLITHYEAKLIN